MQGFWGSLQSQGRLWASLFSSVADWVAGESSCEWGKLSEWRHPGGRGGRWRGLQRQTEDYPDLCLFLGPLGDTEGTGALLLFMRPSMAKLCALHRATPEDRRCLVHPV